MTSDFQSSSIKLRVLETPDEVAQCVAAEFADAIHCNPKIVLGLATGGSPVATYKKLIQLHRRGDVHFRRVTSFNLDEYIGLSADHPQSFRYFMQSELFDHVDIDPNRTFVPDGGCINLDQHIEEYERRISATGGIDLQLLGIGSNGHIAFNEPGSPADSRTRQVSLTAETVQANSRFFDSIDDVPTQAITMGIGTIMEARKIVLLACGTSKAQAIAAALQEPITTACPASLLRSHSDVTFVIDREAASRLE